MTDQFLNSELSLFYQREPDGATTYLDEVALSDLRLSGREAGSPYEVPATGERGTFRIKGFLPGGLILPGFSCQRPWQEINMLWNLTKEGKVSFRLNAAKTGAENDVENYKSALLYVQADVTNPGVEGGKAMQSGDAALNLTTMQVQALHGYELLPLNNASRQTTTEDQLANGVYFAPANKSSELRRRTGQHGIVTPNAVAAGIANVLRTIDYGGTWTAATADPFSTNEHPGHPLIVDLPQTNQYRVIVFRTVTDAANPSELAYTDVTPGTAAWGASWNAVNIGSVNAYFITAAFRVHDGLLLCGDDQGNVYYSKNKGITWTAASYGGSNDVRCFAHAPDGTLWAGGDSAEVYYSEDNGETWSAVTTAPAGAVTGIAVNHEGHVYIIDNTTLLKRSKDGGRSWTTVTVTGEAVTALKAIQFDEYGFTGTILVDDAGADDRLFRTEDGGVSWVAQTTGTSNTGYNAAWLCSPNLIYVVGDVVTTTWIEKVFGPGQGS